MQYRVGDLIIDTGPQQVTRNGDAIALPKLSYDLLIALVRVAPNLVSIDALMAEVWPKLVVSPETVSQRIKLLRDALGDDPRNPRYVEGLRGRGYRLIPAVKSDIPSADAPKSPDPTSDAIHDIPEPEISSAAAPEVQSATTPILPAPSRRWRVWAIALTVALIVGAFGVRKIIQSELSKPTTSVAVVAVPPRSVAVLPFVDMSEKKDQEYFGDGMAEELIDTLTKVPELHVPARTSSFYFKGKQTTIPEIAKTLGVDNVLEGSVRKSGNTIRITAQLVRADNGYRVWSQTFDRQLDDILKVQDEIARAVVKSLKLSLLESQGLRATPPANTEAYTLYLQGRWYWQRRSAADNKKAAEYLRQALKLDPTFAAAWAVLAEVVQYSAISYQDARAEAYPAAEQALKLDPTLSDAHLAMAQILHDLDFDFKGANAEISQALALDPGNAGALRVAGDLALSEGRFDEARQFAQQAVARDPLAVENYRALGDANFYSGRLEEAEGAWRKALEQNAAAEAIHFRLGELLLQRGEPAAALTEMEQSPEKEWRILGLPLALDALGRKSEADRAVAVAAETLSNTAPFLIGLIYAHRNDLDQAFLWLERAYQMRDRGLPHHLKGNPLLKNLRQDPRYKALLKKMNLPE